MIYIVFDYYSDCCTFTSKEIVKVFSKKDDAEFHILELIEARAETDYEWYSIEEFEVI